jgi:hypothetical protein
MSALGGKADVSVREKVLESGRNLLNHLEWKWHSFESKRLKGLKNIELPKLHTRV